MSEKIVIHPDPDIADLVPEYLAGKKVELKQMQDAYGAGDAETVAKLAHRILGTAASYGFDGLGSFAGELEQAALSNEGAEIERLLTAMTDYLGRVEIGDPAPEE